MSNVSIHKITGRQYVCRVWQNDGFTDCVATKKLVFELSAWCRMNLESRSYGEKELHNSEGRIDGVVFSFTSDEDVMAFKLMWSE